MNPRNRRKRVARILIANFCKFKCNAHDMKYNLVHFHFCDCCYIRLSSGATADFMKSSLFCRNCWRCQHSIWRRAVHTGNKDPWQVRTFKYKCVCDLQFVVTKWKSPFSVLTAQWCSPYCSKVSIWTSQNALPDAHLSPQYWQRRSYLSWCAEITTQSK